LGFAGLCSCQYCGSIGLSVVVLGHCLGDAHMTTWEATHHLGINAPSMRAGYEYDIAAVRKNTARKGKPLIVGALRLYFDLAQEKNQELAVGWWRPF
jgi:hypothetical protein